MIGAGGARLAGPARPAVRALAATLAWVCLAMGLVACTRTPPPPPPRPPVAIDRPEDWIALAGGRLAERAVFGLRALNQPRAGDDGVVIARDGRLAFARAPTRPVRFWGVNGPAAPGGPALADEARQLARLGVNLVRHPVEPPDAQGVFSAMAPRQTAALVETLAGEGIYTHLSLFFPAVWKPAVGLAWLPGYDGEQGAPGVLFFNRELQARYQSWWKALLLARTPGGRRLVDDPALFGLEIVNEDSLLFWTFGPEGIPEPQRRIIEADFAAWATRRYGTIAETLARWRLPMPDRDREGRLGLRPLWQLTHERTPRDLDTVRFLVETERRFYEEQIGFLRGLGFRGLITTSNWVTASPQRLGPLEAYAYTTGDLVDRHGYFTCGSQGEAAEWSLRPGQTYADRSAWRFDPEEPGAFPTIAHPAMEIAYDDKPSMLSEVTWNRPNRFRGEAPLYLAAYGALQDTDALVHFTADGAGWSVKPRFFAQPWTLGSPAMEGQFPAAALIYRKGLVKTADRVVELTLGLDDLFALRGTPLPEQAALDDLRRQDLPFGASGSAESLIDPLAHYVGRTHVTFAAKSAPPRLSLDHAIDRPAGTVTSQTGELALDHHRGLFTMAAERVEAASGNLGAGEIVLPHLTITSPLDLGHVALVSLDDQPLAAAKRMLLQVMSEERPRGWKTAPAGGGRQRIEALGTDPWTIRALRGRLLVRRPDGARLSTEALDLQGLPTGRRQSGPLITLEPGTLHYLVTSP